MPETLNTQCDAVKRRWNRSGKGTWKSLNVFPPKYGHPGYGSVQLLDLWMCFVEIILGVWLGVWVNDVEDS